MASEGPNNPGTMADDDTVGTVIWGSLDDAKTSNNAYANAVIGIKPQVLIEHSIRLVKGGTIQGDDKSTGAEIPGTDTYISYGASDNLWGLEWGDTDINANDFGVVFSSRVAGSTISHYLKATNFGFSIPSGATINGILVQIEEDQEVVFVDVYARIDHIRITVYYTEAPPERVPKPTAAVGNPYMFQVLSLSAVRTPIYMRKPRLHHFRL